METHRPLILISNDDGIQSRGLLELIDAALELGDVVAVAPMQQQSGQSSAMTIGKMLRVIPCPDYKSAKMFAVSGSPVDCVKLALHTISPRKPDFMFSGINHGSNAGINAIYSGTMGACMEACMAGIPAVAFSLLSHDPNADFSKVRPFVRELASKAFKSGLPKDICLNINMPYGDVPNGIKVVRAARSHWTDEYQEYKDPFGFPFYMLSGHFVNDEPECDETDEYWLQRGYISVVPIRPDQSATDAINEIKQALL